MNEQERAQMWLNFFNQCTPGTVLQDTEGDAWQKDRDAWLRAGDDVPHDADAISWPADVLAGGLG